MENKLVRGEKYEGKTRREIWAKMVGRKEKLAKNLGRRQ